MAENVFDQACRYLVKSAPVGFLHWLLGEFLTFRGWLDTRRLPWPGQPDRICDTVAHLEEETGQPWVVPVEFQVTPDPLMFGRLLGYLGSLWIEMRPDPERGSHFHVLAIVVNLTGQGDSSRDMSLPARGRSRRQLKQVPRTCLVVEEWNVETEDAGHLLRRMARQVVLCGLLALVPLMQGGDDLGIIERWLKLARAEPDRRRRADHGALALVFAEAVGRREIWQRALEGWEVTESQQVLEWQAAARKQGREEGREVGREEGREEGKVKASRDLLRTLLEVRFGPLPQAVTHQLEALDDAGRLRAIFQQALHARNLDDLQMGP